MLTLLTQILTHTPAYVWGLLAALLALGWLQSRTRQLRPAQVAALPLALTGLGLWSMTPGFVVNPVLGLLWLAALALGAMGGRLTPQAPGTAWLPQAGRFHLPGSWIPMAFIIVIFMLRYAYGVASAMHPDLRADLAVQLPLAGVFGVLAGLSIGRALGLMRLMRSAPATMGTQA